MHSCAEAGWKRKRSWKYEKLFHNFNQIFGHRHRERKNNEIKVGNIESYFTISNRFLGKDIGRKKTKRKTFGNMKSYFTISTRFLGKDTKKETNYEKCLEI